MLKKTRYILFYNKNHHIHFGTLLFGNQTIERIGEDCPAKSFRFLGHMVDDLLTWKYHLKHISKKIRTANFALAQCKNLLPFSARKHIYTSLVHSHLNFGSTLYGATKLNLLKNLESQQNKAIRNLANAKYNSHADPIYKKLNILKKLKTKLL